MIEFLMEFPVACGGRKCLLTFQGFKNYCKHGFHTNNGIQIMSKSSGQANIKQIFSV